MKKLGLFALVMGLVVAFAMPALAFTIDGAKGEKMYIGGVLMTDMGWQNRSKENPGIAPGVVTGTERTEFFMAVPNHSRVRGSFDVGNVGGFWEFGMGGNEANSSGAYQTANNYVETRKLFGYYTFGNCQIKAGKDDGYFFSVVPSQYLGLNENLHVFGFGWGALYDTRDPQFRFTQNISKTFGYAVSLLQPTVFTDNTRVSYSGIPRLSAKLMLNFGMVSMYPAFQIQNVKWDNLSAIAAAGSSPDDNLTSWMALLPVVVQAGPFKGTFQFGYGQNSAPFYGGFASSFHAYYRDPVSGRIKDTTDMNGFINLAYTVGPVTPALYFGYDNAKNSDKYKTGDDNNTRMMYGASVVYAVAPGFNIVPEFDYYDYGKTPGNPNKPDVGKEWIGGVQFQFTF